jgi:hypothetical protein
MRKLMMTAVAMMGLSLGAPAAEAKEPPKVAQAQPMTGPTDAEIDEAHRMNREHDAKKAAERAQAQPMKGPTDAEIDEAHRMNREHDAKKARAGIKTQEVMGKVQSASGSDLTIRMPSKHNRKMDFKADAQSKVTKDAQAVSLKDLKEGDEVRVSYQIIGRERIVVSVDAQKAEPVKKP